MCDTPDDAAALVAEHETFKAVMAEHVPLYAALEALVADMTACGSAENPCGGKAEGLVGRAGGSPTFHAGTRRTRWRT